MAFSVFSKTKNILGTYTAGHSTNAAQELARAFSSYEEAEAYSKFFIRKFKGQTHPDIVGEILDVCGISVTGEGFKILVSAYWKESFEDQEKRLAKERLDFKNQCNANNNSSLGNKSNDPKYLIDLVDQI